MSRWFRFYDSALDDPKVQALPGDLFKIWVNLLCVASKCNGECNVTDLPFMLRMDVTVVDQAIGNLSDRGLLEEIDGGLVTPHNWDKRQYKSDTSNERVKKHRNQKRNVTHTVTVTPPDTDTDTETKANALGAVAPATDWRKLLWDEAPPFLAKERGLSTPAAKSLVGRWLKLVGDDCRALLAKIREAQEMADPVSWVEASIRPPPKKLSVGAMFREEARAKGILPDDTTQANIKRLDAIGGDRLAASPGPPRLIAIEGGG